MTATQYAREIEKQLKAVRSGVDVQELELPVRQALNEVIAAMADARFLVQELTETRVPVIAKKAVIEAFDDVQRGILRISSYDLIGPADVALLSGKLDLLGEKL